MRASEQKFSMSTHAIEGTSETAARGEYKQTFVRHGRPLAETNCPLLGSSLGLACPGPAFSPSRGASGARAYFLLGYGTN